MTYPYHIHVRPFGSPAHRSIPLVTCNNYDAASQGAYSCILVCPEDTLVEITHAGLTVWGPYIVGSARYRP